MKRKLLRIQKKINNDSYQHIEKYPKRDSKKIKVKKEKPKKINVDKYAGMNRKQLDKELEKITRAVMRGEKVEL